MDRKIEELLKRRQKLEVALAEARSIRDQMDGKMQSRYDTQKEEWALQCDIYEHQIEQTDKLIAQLQKLQTETQSAPSQDTIGFGSQVELQIEDDEPDIFILLDESGGHKLQGVSTLSVKSPIGKAVLGAKVGKTVFVNVQEEKIKVQILSLKPSSDVFEE